MNVKENIDYRMYQHTINYLTLSPIQTFFLLKDNFVHIAENFNHEDCYKHVGVKIFSDKGLEKLIYQQFITTKLDMIEGLEELRLIELGFRVKMHEILHDGFGVDIPEQISILESRYGYSKG